jgi:hypothetical protein
MVRSIHRAYAAVVISVFVVVGLLAVNAWLGREIAATRIQEPTIQPPAAVLPAAKQTARIPVIDPLSDPLAPVVNVKTPAISRSQQPSPRKALPIYESTLDTDVLLQ